MAKKKLEREIKRIDNAMTVLDEEEKDIIEILLINNRRCEVAQFKYDLSYSRIKQKESEALMKLSRYL